MGKSDGEKRELRLIRFIWIILIMEVKILYKKFHVLCNTFFRTIIINPENLSSLIIIWQLVG